MKRRIEQLLNGIFEYQAPLLHISTRDIRVFVKKGEVYKGSIELTNQEEKKMKGFIYSSSARVAYEPSDFFGISEKIKYEIDTTGLEEGDVLEGAFTICSDLGEHQIPFRLEVEKAVYAEYIDGCTSLEEFAALAKEDFPKAYLFFAGVRFAHMLRDAAPEYLPLYEGLRAQEVSYRSLEEFLMGCGLKEAVRIRLDKSEEQYLGIRQSSKEVLTITKEHWGFLRLDIQVDAPFLEVEHRVVTSDEFVGSTYLLEYVVDKQKLHGGLNYGRMRISTGYDTYTFEVEASRDGSGAGQKGQRGEHKAIAQMMSVYLDFRMKRKGLQEWLDATDKALADYDRAGGKHIFFELYKVQLFFAKERMVDACLALEEIENHKDQLNSAQLKAYYLYLTTFYNRDIKYVDYIEEEVRELYIRNRESWMLQWFLMYLQDPGLLGPLDRLGCVREQYKYGCNSPVMYAEGVQIIQKEPLLLKRLDDFEIQLLRFACKQDVINRELGEQIAELTLRHREFDKGLYEVLTYCYDKYPNKSIVMAICSLLIKGHKTEKEYFRWYAKGVSHELRLTGLYEYYVETMEEDSDQVLPQMIRMYFAYNNTLSYKKKALVYANVIRNHALDPETYKSYRPAMERFMVDQLALGRINRDLALLYDTFLSKAIINKRMADGLARSIFTYEIRCQNSRMKFVIVIHNQLKQDLKVPLVDGTAYIQKYTEDTRILFEDEEGQRYAVNVPSSIERLMGRPIFMEYCKELCPDNPGLVLNSCFGEHQGIDVTADNVDSFARLLEINEIRDEVKDQIRSGILEYYYSHPEAESRYEYLHKIDYSLFVKSDKKKLVELLTAEGLCKEAFSLVSVYGPEKIDLIQLVRLCSRMILEKEYGTDDMLLFLCGYCFTNEKYDETILSYLLQHFDGPIEVMKDIWVAARKFDLDAYEMEEKILIFVIFMRVGVKNTEDIFDSYRKKMGKKKLCLSYAILCSYLYFVKSQEVQQPVFDYCERLAIRGEIPERVCDLALLYHYAMEPNLTHGQEEVILRLMEEISYEGMRFSFFERLPQEFTRPYQLSNKIYIEHRTNPLTRVTLHYRLGSEDMEYATEVMKNMYEGVFVKEFTLFYGEDLTYHFEEELNGQTKETEDKAIHFRKKSKPEGNSQYDLINHMMEAVLTGDEQGIKADTRTYIEQSYFIQRLFEKM